MKTFVVALIVSVCDGQQWTYGGAGTDLGMLPPCADASDSCRTTCDSEKRCQLFRYENLNDAIVACNNQQYCGGVSLDSGSTCTNIFNGTTKKYYELRSNHNCTGNPQRALPNWKTWVKSY
jgi:hypothetical protein